jgi:hypothetical protein
MTDEPEDFFGLNDKGAEAEKLPGLVVGPPLRNNELLAAELEHRNSNRPAFRGSHEIMIIEEDGLTIEEATRWQTMMNFPQAAHWQDRREAQARDDATDANASRGRLAAASVGGSAATGATGPSTPKKA